nr:hypothetical protein [Candidatus Sigynarchaeum springense]
MSPKPKPEEEPVWLNFTIEPTEKARWKVYAKKKGIPLATFIKMEVNKIVNEEFEAPLKNLLAFNKDIFGVVIVQDNLQILYKHGEIESENDSIELSKNWRLYTPVRRFRYLDEPMLIIQCSDERLVIKSSPNSVKGAITIIGYRTGNNVKFLARVKADGNAIVALADLQRVAAEMFPPQPRPVEKGMLEKALPEFYQERSQLQTIDMLRGIPLVAQEQAALEEIERAIGKPIPAIPPFQNGDVTRPNPQFDSTPLMYLAIDGHVVMLRLDRCNLKRIPQDITRFGELQYLSMNDNQIPEIPELLADLSTLKVLSLINNKIAGLPESIWNLQNIEEFTLAGNPITEIPGEDPARTVPEARLRTLRNLVEGNMLTLLNQLKAMQNEMMYHSSNPPNLELVNILATFLKRIKQEIPEDVLHTYVFHRLSGD